MTSSLVGSEMCIRDRYKDEYISDENFDIWLPDNNNPKFGIRLKLLEKNKNWHNFRIQELEKALHELIKYFENKTTIKDDEKTALECIRYLFKDFAFRDEEEFRLLKIVKMDSEEIEYCETTNSIYLPVSYTHLRAHETRRHLVCRLLLEKKK